MLISQGVGRYVYDLGNGFVKKIPKDKKGLWQNESEIRIYNANKNNDLILPLIMIKMASGLYNESVTHFLKILYIFSKNIPILIGKNFAT